MERSGKYLISLFLTSYLFSFWCKEFWTITLIILLIVYILGKSKHLITFVTRCKNFLLCKFWQSAILLLKSFLDSLGGRPAATPALRGGGVPAPRVPHHPPHPQGEPGRQSHHGVFRRGWVLHFWWCFMGKILVLGSYDYKLSCSLFLSN